VAVFSNSFIVALSVAAFASIRDTLSLSLAAFDLRLAARALFLARAFAFFAFSTAAIQFLNGADV
jgi:hypothetical protein